MAKVLRPIGHEDRLSIVDHLDELRTRLFVSLAALAVAFGFCFWQNHALLSVLDRALPHETSVAQQEGLAAQPSQNVRLRRAFLGQAQVDGVIAGLNGLSQADRQQLAAAAKSDLAAAKALPSHVTAQEKPITIGVGEPFMTTLTVAGYFALLFSLPVIIYQLYAFVIPALSAQERRVAMPVMAAAPLMFVLGAAFAYVVVLPPAVHFLQGYNADQFNVLVSAKSYYTFEILTMLGIGVAFQLPLGLLGLQKVGVINGSTLTRNWRYATVLIAVIAAAMPGSDPVTTGLEALPLVVLFLASIVLLKIADRRAARRAAAEAAAAFGDGLETS
ncbi:MAG: twin-arginine translocase subunit TatC [Solirubrobacteraceae bacterium]